MRAAVYRRFGGPEVVEVVDRPAPTPGPGDVLIRVQASTVSAADYRARTRDVPRGLGLLVRASLGVVAPRRQVLGMDVAGTVDAVGSAVTSFAPGDEVIAMLGTSFGGHAESAVLPADGAIARKPRGMSFEEAVTLVFGGLTARGFLRAVDLSPGTTVLVNGASGAVGTAVVQLAALQGAHVTAVCSAGNAELVRSLGADATIDYAAQDFTEAGPFDVVVDCVGTADFDRVEASITPGGALLAVVADLPALLRAKGRSRRSGKQVVTSGGPYLAGDLAHLAALADAGEYRAVVERTYPLDEIVDAHRFVATGRKRGSVVVRIRSEP